MGKQLAAVAVILALLGLVGNLEAEDEVAQQEHACYMFKAGLWPDYGNQCQQPSAVRR